MLSIILLLLMLAKGLSAPTHSVYLGVLWIVLSEVLLFFLSSPPSGSEALSPLVSSWSSVVLGAWLAWLAVS